MLLKAAINGSRSTAEHPGVPCRPDEIAREARAAVAAGAGAIHFHVRGPDARESLDAASVAASVSAARAACPGVPIGISTGAWIISDPVERLALVRAWTVCPDFASLNVHEPGALDLCRLLLERGIGVEAGLWHEAGARLWADSGLAALALRVMIEPTEKEMPEALANLARIEAVLAAAGVDTPILVHGLGPTAWDFIDVSVERGYATRIGLEDTLVLPDGRRADDNAALVRAARERIDAARAGRRRA
jgi:uncharacterized protein (DUF849 family)